MAPFRRPLLAAFIALVGSRVLATVMWRTQPPAVAQQIASVTLYPPQIAPGGVTLTWSAYPTPANYVISRLDPETMRYAALTIVPTTAYVDANLYASGRYCWVIAVAAGDLQSGPSNSWCISVTSPVPQLIGVVEGLFLPPSPSPTATVAATIAPTASATATPAPTTTPSPAPTATPSATPVPFALEPARLSIGCAVARLQSPAGTPMADILHHFSIPTAILAIWAIDPASGHVQALYFEDTAAPADLQGRTLTDQQLVWICTLVPVTAS